MAINSPWQQYLRLQQHPACGSVCWNVRHNRVQILASEMLRKLKKIKAMPWEKEQLHGHGEQQIIDRDCSSWHQSSVVHP